MLDLGWTELLVIGVVALIVVGPKDLPILFRKAGEFVGRMKGMAREFSRAMNDAAEESGMRETADSLRKMANPKQMGIDGVKDAVNDIKKWEPDSETADLAAEGEEKRNKMVEEANASAAETAREVREAHAAREAREAAAAEGSSKTAKPASKKTTAKKPAAKKPATKKPADKKPAAKKAAPKKTGATSKSTSKPSGTKAAASKGSSKPAPSKAAPKKASGKPASKGSSKDTS